MAERKMDICVVSKTNNSTNLWVPLKKERMLALVPSSYPVAQKECFSISLFESLPYIKVYPGHVTDAEKVMQKHGTKPNTCFTTSDRYAAHEMVAAGLGVTLLNEAMVLYDIKNVTILPLEEPHWIEIGMAYLPNPTLAAKRFVDFMMELPLEN